MSKAKKFRKVVEMSRGYENDKNRNGMMFLSMGVGVIFGYVSYSGESLSPTPMLVTVGIILGLGLFVHLVLYYLSRDVYWEEIK